MRRALGDEGAAGRSAQHQARSSGGTLRRIRAGSNAVVALGTRLRSWRRPVAGAVVVVALAHPACAQTTDAARAPGALSLFGRSIAHTLTTPVRWDADDWLLLPALGVGVAFTTAIDDGVRDAFRRSRDDMEDFADTIEHLGTVENYTILGGFLAVGIVAADAKARAVAVEGLASSLVSAGLVTPVLQRATGRSRPWTNRGAHAWDPFSGNISFPSGHTTQAFAVASVIATEYDAWWVDLSAYGLAAMVGVSRMVNDAHHLSDVAAGALIGTLVGRSVASFGKALRTHAQLTPDAGTNGIGMTVRFQY